MIDEKWSGWIDLFTYDEHYFIGFQIEKGQITNTRKFNKNAPNGKFYIGKENMDVRCKIVETVWINVTIAGDVMTITSLESTLSQFCTVGGNDSYTSGGGSYSYGGDSYSSNGGY